MASNLRKFKYNGPAGNRHNAASNQNTAKKVRGAPSATAEPAPSPEPLSPASVHLTEPEDNMTDLKTEILLAIKADIAEIIKSELRAVVAEDFSFVKNELAAVKTNTANLRSDLDHVLTDVNDIKDGLSTWSDEVVALQDEVKKLNAELGVLRGKCEDMEGRMRRCNVRILGVPETSEANPAAVSKMLQQVLQLVKEPLVDRSHRSPGQSRSGGRPRVIVAKLHYYQDCVEILRGARTRGQLRFKDALITIVPDYTSSVAKARAAFTDVRRLLRDREGVRYGLLFPARLRITHGGEDKRFADPNEAMAYVQENIIKATADK